MSIDVYNIARKYPDALEHSEWAMDFRHVLVIYNVICACKFNRIIEVGSHFGFSTTAFVEALKKGALFDFHVCDIKIEKSVRDLSMMCRMQIHECKSTTAIRSYGPFDLAVLDGSHISEDVEDEFELLSMHSTGTYILHDSNTQLLPESSQTPWYDGPLFLKNKLMASPDWMCVEDCKYRIGERTDRGLFIATRRKDVYESALSVISDIDDVTLP